MPYPMLRSSAWRSLSGAAVKVFFELHCRFQGTNNGKIILSMNDATEVLGIGKATAQRAFKELQEKGFIVLTTPGNWYSRRAHEWRLTHKPVHKFAGKVAPTNDWRLYRPPKKRRKKQNCGSDTDPSQFSVVPFENPKTRSGSV
jgi:biotin operon repressor